MSNGRGIKKKQKKKFEWGAKVANVGRIAVAENRHGCVARSAQGRRMAEKERECGGEGQHTEGNPEI